MSEPKKRYVPPRLNTLNREQTALSLLGQAWDGNQSAKELLDFAADILFPPLSQNQKETAMPLVVPFHSTEEETKPSDQTRVYHNNSECEEARKIPIRRRLDGTEGYQLCPICRQLIEQLSKRGT
jgi:hypothetical protein